MSRRVKFESNNAASPGAAHLPTLAIVGRPNVGKSTLFNRLVRSRRAIVGDEPGITRDRIYGEAEWAGRTLRVVDTGGIVPDDQALIPSEIFRQARVALDEADAIVLVVDGRTELASPDIDLARLLLKTGKPLLLAVNKVDTPKLEPYAEEFRRLGIKELFPISAENGNGLAELLEHALSVIPRASSTEDQPAADEPQISRRRRRSLVGTTEKKGSKQGPRPAAVADDDLSSLEKTNVGEGDGNEVAAEEAAELSRETKVAIIGRPNVGKSTLLNVLTGTARAIVSPVAGTTRDAVDELIEHGGREYRFIDTAGIRRKGKTELMAEKLSVVMARKHLENADVALMIIDATEGVTSSDATIAGYAHESGRSVIVVINKWDLVTENRSDGKPPAERSIYEEQVRRHLKFLSYAPVVFVSATTGKGIDRLFSTLELVARERRKRIGTGAMNRFLSRVDFERASVPMAKRVKIYYLTQAAVAPPTFILFTDRAIKLHFSYERFLENQIRAAFGFVGSPIWIKNRARGEGKK